MLKVNVSHVNAMTSKNELITIGLHHHSSLSFIIKDHIYEHWGQSLEKQIYNGTLSKLHFILFV